MEEDSKCRSDSTVSQLGTFPRAVDACVDLGRAIWNLAYPIDGSESKISTEKGQLWKFSLQNIHQQLPRRSKAARYADSMLCELGRVEPDGNAFISFHAFAQPVSIARLLLASYERHEHDLKYFAMRNLRQHYRFDRDAETVRIFRLLSETMNSLLKRHKGVTSQQGLSRVDYSTILDNLKNTLTTAGSRAHAQNQRAIGLFFAMSRAVGYILPAYDVSHLRLATDHIDSEYLISNLYGLPTTIPGFDELFGGGGIAFAESSKRGKQERGRAVLIKGRFGTGKTILALQLAAEIARKGGCALYTALEQSNRDCEYTLESINALPDDGSVLIASTSADAADSLSISRANGGGTLIIQDGTKDSFEAFLATLQSDAESIEKYPLRIVCVDPVNAIYRDGQAQPFKLRADFLETITRIKDAGTNLVLLSEEDTDRGIESWFEENIVDTVINLTETQEHAYSRRYFEIKKSRLQREQRGVHPYSIQSGIGIKIYPSSAAVGSRIRKRQTAQILPTEFGLPSLDRILGTEAIHHGDIVLLKGPSGSYKTPLGILFLMPRDGRRKETNNISLLIDARESEDAVGHHFKSKWFGRHYGAATHISKKQKEDIRIVTLPVGHVHPGVILQTIEEEFEKAKRRGESIDRVMIDNISHWELSCPFVAADEVFSDTLIDLLRSHRATSLLICNDFSGQSTVQRPMIDSADCVIEFDRFEFRGQQRVSIRIAKTREMKHLRQSYELAFANDLFSVKPTSSLIRVNREGRARLVPIKLFLHAESEEQIHYNSRWAAAVGTVLSTETEVKPQQQLYAGGALDLGRASAVDELHVLQLDEYQLPNKKMPTTFDDLYTFSEELWNKDRWDGFINSYTDRCRLRDGFIAVPYYADVGLLAYREDLIEDASIVNSWQSLAKSCEDWEKRQEENENSRDGAPVEVFFDFPHVTGENYNSLFFEILASFEDPPANGDFLAWMKNANLINACDIFWRLARQAYRRELDRRRSLTTRHQQPNDVSSNFGLPFAPAKTEFLQEPYRVSKNCIVWRHWFSTLNQMLADLDLVISEQIRVAPVPGSRPVSGEWYLAVPAYSAAPEVGLSIIKQITGVDGELERLGRGVGLPLRYSFYSTDYADESSQTSIGAHLTVDSYIVKDSLKNAFRRSDLAGYRNWNNSLTQHLQLLLRVPDGDPTARWKRFENIMAELRRNVSFVIKR